MLNHGVSEFAICSFSFSSHHIPTSIMYCKHILYCFAKFTGPYWLHVTVKHVLLDIFYGMLRDTILQVCTVCFTVL